MSFLLMSNAIHISCDKVYVLKLEHGKWFIEKTKNLDWNMKLHYRGSPPWLDLHTKKLLKMGIKNF